MVDEIRNQPNRLVIDPLKYLSNLPDFFGDSKDLQNFTALIDRINPHLETYDELSKQLFLDIIKSKLKGKARQTIEINCHATSWTQMKIVLQNNFGDRRTCDELFDVLRATTFKTNTVEFYNEVKDKLHRLNNKIVIILGETDAARQSARNNMQTALNIFKSKIPEPMKTILFCRNPIDIEEAMDILFQAGYAYSSNPDNQKHFTPRHQQTHNNGNNYNRSSYKNSSHNRPNNQNNFHNSQNYRENQRYTTYNQRQNSRNPVQQHYGQNNAPDLRPQNQFHRQNIPRESIQWHNNHNFQPTQRQEPMDVNVNVISENFRDRASGSNFHI